MDLGLGGKRVLVTGGTRGIGAATVDQFLAEGARVAFCARDEAQVKAKEKSLRDKGFDVSGAVVDVRDHAAYVRWIGETAKGFGGLDVFVPNVSGGGRNDKEPWLTAFEVDLMATVKGCEAVLPHMAAHHGGAIVVISSIAAIETMGAPAAYNTMKAALINYASQLGEMTAYQGVRVNTVSPGPIHVEDGFWGNLKRTVPDAYEGVRARHPFGRLGTPEEVARAIVFLASDAASWITRTNVMIDGGFTRRVQF